MTGAKLWRQYQTFAHHIHLLCVDCAAKNQEMEILAREDGKHEEDGLWVDAIGWLVPAVPNETEETFWGYTSVPEDRVVWWRNLPLRTQVFAA
jgi:hypothetical protein